MSTFKKAVLPEGGLPANALYSPALIVGNMVYVSGHTGVDPGTGDIVDGSVADRTSQILKNISELLERAGSHIDNTVKVSIYLTSMNDYALMNQSYAQVFNQEVKPVRTCVAVKELPRGTDVEIDVVALL